MKRTAFITLLILAGGLCSSGFSQTQTIPDRGEVLKTMIKVNDYFMTKYADYAQPSNRRRIRPSNIWTRGVYYEGLMALHAIYPKEAYYDYALNWSEFHQWGMRNGNTTRNADDHCCGQTYIDLYKMEPDPKKIRNIKISIDMLVNTPQNDDWWWIDAIQMAMPIFAQLGQLFDDDRYFEKMYQMYAYTKNVHGGNGLYNPKDGLWWRDADFVPPYKEPNGEDCYWSRGNGWVYAALVRVLDLIPQDDPHRKEYTDDFLAMTRAIQACQRSDGFWNVSLHDPNHFGGKESSGTALFLYGMAWGVNKGLLSASEYLPIINKTWNALANEAVHPNGFLGWVQGTGKEPKDGQPLSYDKEPDYEDYGIGCFLLGAGEVYKLKAQQ